MADYTVTLSAAVETILNRDHCGNGKDYANIGAWVTSKMNGMTNALVRNAEEKRFSALTTAQKTAALTAGEAA